MPPKKRATKNANANSDKLLGCGPGRVIGLFWKFQDALRRRRWYNRNITTKVPSFLFYAAAANSILSMSSTLLMAVAPLQLCSSSKRALSQQIVCLHRRGWGRASQGLPAYLETCLNRLFMSLWNHKNSCPYPNLGKTNPFVVARPLFPIKSLYLRETT